MPTGHALHYFAAVAKGAGGEAYSRWCTALQFELGLHAASFHYCYWAYSLLESARVWVVDAAHIEWLRVFQGLPKINLKFRGGRDVRGETSTGGVLRV